MTSVIQLKLPIVCTLEGHVSVTSILCVCALSDRSTCLKYSMSFQADHYHRLVFDQIDTGQNKTLRQVGRKHCYTRQLLQRLFC